MLATVFLVSAPDLIIIRAWHTQLSRFLLGAAC